MNDEEAMQRLRDGVREGKERLKKGRLPIGEEVKEEEKKGRGRPKGARNRSKLGDRRVRP